ncbi:MAG: hypothetical protein CME31_21675 [Gimesia sp.]|uniref:Uncharacterized protein n=1 Tax=Gimesia maris TaxID=122 RepID=A0A3D3R2M1_9PLAN|nr:hypothetical protein [Gimesia sp.]HCO22999.1 hypothetical protein [Gimesia maris]
MSGSLVFSELAISAYVARRVYYKRCLSGNNSRGNRNRGFSQLFFLIVKKSESSFVNLPGSPYDKSISARQSQG